MNKFTEWIGHSRTFRIVAGFVVACGLLAAIGWLVTGHYRLFVQPFDSAVRGGMREFQSPLWTSLFLTITKFGSTIYLIVIGCIAGLAFVVLRWFRPLLLFVLTMAGQAALHHGFKYLFARPRPPSLIQYANIESFSFPSGHAISSLCLYSAIAWILSNRTENTAAKAGIWIAAAILIFLIGLSRVYIGIHYPSDLIAGFIAAAVWTTAVISCDKTES